MQEAPFLIGENQSQYLINEEKRKIIEDFSDFILMHKSIKKEVGGTVTMFLIAGLGNPTAKYAKTRHNAGFDVIDAIADKYGIDMNLKKGNAICGTGYIEGQKVMLAKPQTFMNLSGDSVSALVNFYKLDPTQELIVVFDDISLAPGNLRIRKKGSAGGHNGIKDIIAKTGTDQFERVKVGVGEKPAGWNLADHVLGRFSPEDREKFEDAVKDAVDAVSLMVQDRTDEAMNQYNRKKV